jgi:hypothetical protein
VNPEFLKVLPADIGRVGFDGATLLALIRWRTEFDDGRHGRVTIDGTVWWRASQRTIAETLGGISHDKIARCVSKLEKAEELVIFDPKDSPDRSLIYTMPDLSLRDSALPMSSHYANPRDGDADSRHGDADSRHGDADSRHALFYRDVRDVETKEENGADAPALAAVEPSVIRKPQTAKTARKKTAKTPIPDGWSPTAEQLLALAEKYPDLDIAWELESFQDWALASGAEYVDWLAAFRKRLLGGGDFNKPRSHHRSGSQYANNDQKVLGWLTVGTNNTPALPQDFIEGETA